MLFKFGQSLISTKYFDRRHAKRLRWLQIDAKVIQENCFTVAKLQDGRYEAYYHGTAVDSMFMNFEVLE